MSQRYILAALVTALWCAGPAVAQEQTKDERGGSCEDAKAQFEYFCNRKGHENDIMMNAPIACNNAKRNMAAACEGKSEADAQYKFDEHGKIKPQ